MAYMNITNHEASGNVRKACFLFHFTPSSGKHPSPVSPPILYRNATAWLVCTCWRIDSPFLQRKVLHLLLINQARYFIRLAMISPSLLFRTFRMHNVALACMLFGSFVLAPRAEAQQTPLMEIVREAVQNELNDDAQTHLLAWTERKHQGPRTQIERLVTTPQGILSRVVLINGKPLTPAQRSEEEQRFRKMLDPVQIRRKLKEQQEDDERTRKMLSAIPDAFDFAYIDTFTAPNGHKLSRLKFTPRPGFSPPSRESMVFTGMQGELLLDESAHRIAKIDGKLFKDVNFGWGILGKLYKGGRFFVEKSEVSPTHWETSKTILHFDGKILLVKSLHIDENETDWDFQPVPPMSVEQAADFLIREQPSQNANLSEP